ncbi:hypothetical protein [Leucobacter sp.]
MIDAYTNLPPELQSAALATGVFVAAVALASGTVMLGIPKYAAFRMSLKELGITAESTSASLAKIAPAGIAIAAVPIAANMVDWIRSFRDTSTAAAELERELKKTGDISQELTQGLAGGNPLANLGIGTDEIALNHLRELNTVVGDLHATFENTTLGKALTLSMGGLSSGAGEAKQQIEDLDTALAGMVSAGRADEAAAGFEQFAKMAKEAGWEQDDLNAKLPKYAAAQEDAALASQEASEAAAANSDALAELSESAVSTEAAVEDLADTIRNFGKAQFDVERSSISFQDALAALDEQMNSGVASWDVTTEAGRETRQMLLEVASSTNDHAAAIAAAGGDQEAYSAVLEQGRQKLYDVALALTGSKDAAREYADQLVATPEQVATQVQLMGAELAEQILANLTRTRETYINVIATGLDEANNALKNAFGSANGNMFAYANGGMNDYANMVAFADGGIVDENTRAMANGGIETGIYTGGTPLYKFAEPETGWEAFISGKPSERDRNRQIWAETGNRLGMGAGSTSTVYVPTEVTVKDVNGRLIGTMEVVADKQIDMSIQQQAQANRRAGL